MSKLNPQKATAYVGPGVLRKGGKITPVPNGPLIKKKGPYAGSTLKSGGAIKKAQNGTKTKDSTAYFQKRMDESYESAARNINSPKYSEQAFKRAKQASLDAERQKLKGMPGYDKNGFPIKKKKAQEGVKIGNTTYTITNSTKDTIKGNPKYPGTRTPRTSMSNSKTDQGISSVKRLLKSKAKNGVKTKKAMMGSSIFKDNPIYKKSTEARGMIGKLYGLPGKPIVKNGGMLKRADGSYSKRGLWDNIRANKGSGKKPTAAMLKQEKKIKAKSKK
jgi:hypothetical protein